LEFENDGAKVRLQVQDEKAIVHLCDGIRVEKELKGGHEVMVAQI
jgi:hypothetical protein